jgi:hypothetical protein
MMPKIDIILCLSLMVMALLAVIAADVSLAKSRELEVSVRNYMVMTMVHDHGVQPPVEVK